MIKQTMIKPSSINVCAQFEKPWLKIHGNTTNRTPTNPIPKIVSKAMNNIFSFINQGIADRSFKNFQGMLSLPLVQENLGWHYLKWIGFAHNSL